MQATLSSYSVDDTCRLAGALTPMLRAGFVIVLSGPMGSGKTRFVQALLAPLAPQETVQSPTFSLVNVYRAPGFPVYHVDFFRLDSEEELWAAGWEDYLDESGVLLIEWGDRFPGALPGEYLEIEFCPTEKNAHARLLRLSARGQNYEDLLRRWLDAVASH